VRGRGAAVGRRSAAGRDVSAEASGVAKAAQAAGFATVLALLFTLPLTAQSRITTTVDTARVTVGDRITMTVTVEHPEGAHVVWPDSLDLAPFEVVEARVAPPAAAGTTQSAATLTLTAFELGELEIPSFDVEVVGSDGARETLSTNAYGIEAVSVGIDESGDIRDIRGPLGIPMGLLRILLLALLPLLLIALLYVAARRLRSRESEEPEPALAPLERPAHEIALEALARLEAARLLEQGQVKEFHIEVSDILRSYVERRFRVDALEMTTREVLQGLERAGADVSFREGLGAFLDQCDMVKFAKVRPGPDQSRQVLELGRRLVQRSAPGAAPGPATAGEAA
jgi:hypothetical protein